ncbi:HAD hydrolase-like protein [Prosthecobacter sp.]|uniref:HAD family hydrolase n=1 Tax=Prosthecobacter sp. TaxID=1965333 RepID=UPI002ABC7559|nr:HAD hydrolase-like protein [Prosthecobacter sp.]MDZ4405794.1 HAD hydrolase-like protein [Prosthecobacter sp.]
MPVSVIAFDLDGTLIDSNPVKRQGFDHVFAGFNTGTATVARVLETHRKAFRTVVIRLVLEQLHAASEPGCEPTEERVLELAARYNRFCIDGAVSCPEITGAAQTLQQLSASHKLFINTATAGEAAVEIIERRGWSHLFTGVLGFPPGKLENLQTAAAQTRVQHRDVLMVGDDDHDAEAATAFDCPFIAVQGPTSHFTRPPAMVITRLDELPPLLALL